MQCQCHFLLLSGLLWVIFSHLHGAVTSFMLGDDPTRRAEYLDPQERYLLEWEPLWSSGSIVFNLTVQTRGFVAFGLTSSQDDANMGGVDMLIAGVFQHGKVYFLDHHMYKDNDPVMDYSQDYRLHDAWESQSHTFISFSRPLDTCDPHDHPISDNKITIIWAYGEYDDHEDNWRYATRGSHEVYLLDPDYSPKIARNPENGDPKVISQEKLETWSMKKKMRIPSNETAYICSIYRGPRFLKKRHIVGFDVSFANEESRRHVHHLLVYKCYAPQGLNNGIFEPYVGSPGQACYGLKRHTSVLHFCTQFYGGWALGGSSFFLPPHVGIPFGTTPDEYYMMQVHYNNPEQLSDVVVDLRLDYFYTSNLRPNDAGFMSVGHEVPGVAPSLLVPPSSPNHRIFGHCSSECTRRMYPAEGIKLLAVLLHTHDSGKSLRLHHFSSQRDPKNELPWILYDHTYNNAFQQFRHLHEERRVLPGDQLTVECTYDTTWSNESSVVGGYGTKQEMCLAFLGYYNKIPDYNMCRSEIADEKSRKRFLGIENITWVDSQQQWVATGGNTRLAGRSVQQISDGLFNWDWSTRQELQRFHEVQPHVGKCNRDLYARTPTSLQALVKSGALSGPETGQVRNMDTRDDLQVMVDYPQVRPYFLPETCSDRGWYTRPLL